MSILCLTVFLLYDIDWQLRLEQEVYLESDIDFFIIWYSD
jgi:hypothetical protein